MYHRAALYIPWSRVVVLRVCHGASANIRVPEEEVCSPQVCTLTRSLVEILNMSERILNGKAVVDVVIGILACRRSGRPC